MNSFSDYLAQGNAWLFIPTALVLGALHGLEPGHSKTMMAAFIISIRGTVKQAALLGIAATISHTAIIWVLAFIGLHYAERFSVETVEPWLHLATGVVVMGMAAWMFHRLRRAQGEASPAHSHSHSHSHGPGDEHHHEVEPDDAHAREHAAELQRRFANREVTTGQIVLFGLTGGLLPCPSAFAVLLVCLQLKQFALGFALVLAFSLGLALTLVSVGTLAALSVRHATQRLRWLGPLTRRLPYVSSLVLGLIGLAVTVQALRHLNRLP
jgi:nickel/cobalt transporter (NicO) family protein